MHAISLHEKRLVDFHVARCKLEIGRDAERFLVRGLVHPDIDPTHLLVAKVAILGAITNNEQEIISTLNVR